MRQNVDKASSCPEPHAPGLAPALARSHGVPPIHACFARRLHRRALGIAAKHLRTHATPRSGANMSTTPLSASRAACTHPHPLALTTRTRAPPHSPRRVRRQSIGRYAIGSCLPRPMRSPGPQTVSQEPGGVSPPDDTIMSLHLSPSISLHVSPCLSISFSFLHVTEVQRHGVFLASFSWTI